MQLFVQGNISFLTPFSFLLFSTNLFASISLRGCALPTAGKGNFSNVLGLPLTSSPGSPVLFCLVLFLNVQKKYLLAGLPCMIQSLLLWNPTLFVYGFCKHLFKFSFCRKYSPLPQGVVYALENTAGESC